VAVSQSIAVINAGPSSIKFALYDVVREEISLSEVKWVGWVWRHA
jgi:acetate kinase